jgi:copper chaperone NosL
MNSPTKKFSALSRVLLIVSGLCLALSIFVPIWRIDLDAPQYPEGLRLLIHSNKLGGNVDIINGLNHYIGMKTLHAEEFIEFTVLPYIIGFFALFSLVAGIADNRKVLYTLFILFVLFGIVAMVDFWRWEYNYGHNLDPNAAIIVPGMAYQPPLIGFKQLLNFGAYSVPAAGGWLFVTSGVLMLVCILIERNFFRKKMTTPVMALLALTSTLTVSCGNRQPEAVKLNSDNCEFCRMTISDARFAAEMVTPKGRIYKFDDVACLLNYREENPNIKEGRLFVTDYSQSQQFVEAGAAFYIRGEAFGSPMGGNIAAFAINDSAMQYAKKTGAPVLKWSEIEKSI